MLRAALLCEKKKKKKCQSSCFEQEQFLTTWPVVCDVREATKKPIGVLPQCERLTANVKKKKKKKNTATTGTNLQNILKNAESKKKKKKTPTGSSLVRASQQRQKVPIHSRDRKRKIS